MAQFMFVLYDDPSAFAHLSPEEMQTMIEDYVGWTRRMAAEGKLVIGQKLKDEGGRKLTCRKGDVKVTDGPFAESKEVLGGFYVVHADDYDAAVALAKSCPHAKYGVRIDVREVEVVGAER